MGETVVLGVDASPVLDPPEHVLDFMTPSVKHGVVGDGDFALDFEGMQAIVLRSASACRNQSAS